MLNQIKNMRIIRLITLASLGSMLVWSCSKEASNSTGWNYNDSKQGGFQKVPFVDQETGPGLVLIEGGTFTMGRAEEDVMYDWNNRPTRVSVSSFYMDQTEVTNFHWLEYLYWINRAYGETYPLVYKNALPDTLSWRAPLGFMEKFVDYYLRHPAYRDYPVVGVSWLQANDFCKWRTDRVNEYILVREGILDWNTKQRDENTFNSDAYYVGQYDDAVKNGVKDINPDNMTGKKSNKPGKRIVRMEDGIMLPAYRLPTEAEWEYAALGLIGNLQPGTENISDRRFYPWDGHWVRQDNKDFTGKIRANFMRSGGDYMGIAGNLNDGADVTAPVESFWPNDFGLYHMAGNVSEWVLDTYRPLSSEDYSDFRPFRGNVFKTKLLDNQGVVDAKNAFVMYDVHAMKEYVNEFERIRYQRISASQHNPNDPGLPIGLDKNIESRNPVRAGSAPDAFYVSHGKVKDSIELSLLRQINGVLDTAIRYKNDKYLVESSMLIQERLFDEMFADELREGPDGEEYAFEILSMLRVAFSGFIIDTPGKLKYRNVTEEENIGRLNYRKDDYVDYLDGDIESSIFYKDDNRKMRINQGSRDPKLVMYQNQHEEYDLDGNQIIPGGENRAAWPTTLISDKSKVYKGGSWADRAYWQVASNRRFLDERQSMCTLGFRCAMDRIGSPVGQNYGKKKKKK